ncbi:hypothetical protein SAMN02990966_04428 [Rhodospirillales bacterium URHD0017]|nr:hypothetical protein SAMN02990966_04428 [Rhodospirillales bacterium URHD0017]
MNRPITLWLLSTVAVGILTFTYGQYSACRASLAVDSSRFARLSEELVFRVGGIYGLTLVNNVQASSYLLVLDPDRHFLFSEFKGRVPNELVAEVKQLLRKWHPSGVAEITAADRRGVSNPESKAVPSTVPLNEPGLTTPRTIAEFVQQLQTEPDDIFGLVDGWIVMHRTLPLASTPESVAAITTWGRALGKTALPYFDNSRERLGSTSTCFKRAFWPFA